MMLRHASNHYVAPSALAGFSMTRPVALPPIIRIRSSKGNRANYRRLSSTFFSLPQIVTLLEVGDTANPSGLNVGLEIERITAIAKLPNISSIGGHQVNRAVKIPDPVAVQDIITFGASLETELSY